MKKLLVPKSAAHVLHKAHNPVHMLYFGLVAVEAGKWYGLAAACLLLISLADSLLAPRKPHLVEIESKQITTEGEP